MAMGIWAEFVYGTERQATTLCQWICGCVLGRLFRPRPLDAEVPICRDVFLEVFCPAG